MPCSMSVTNDHAVLQLTLEDEFPDMDCMQIKEVLSKTKDYNTAWHLLSRLRTPFSTEVSASGDSRTQPVSQAKYKTSVPPDETVPHRHWWAPCLPGGVSLGTLPGVGPDSHVCSVSSVLAAPPVRHRQWWPPTPFTVSATVEQQRNHSYTAPECTLGFGQDMVKAPACDSQPSPIGKLVSELEALASLQEMQTREKSRLTADASAIEVVKQDTWSQVAIFLTPTSTGKLLQLCIPKHPYVYADTVVIHHQPPFETLLTMPLGVQVEVVMHSAAADAESQVAIVSLPHWLRLGPVQAPCVTISTTPGVTAAESGRLAWRALHGTAEEHVHYQRKIRLLGTLGVQMKDGTIICSLTELQHALHTHYQSTSEAQGQPTQATMFDQESTLAAQQQQTATNAAGQGFIQDPSPAQNITTGCTAFSNSPLPVTLADFLLPEASPALPEQQGTKRKGTRRGKRAHPRGSGPKPKCSGFHCEGEQQFGRVSVDQAVDPVKQQGVWSHLVKSTIIRPSNGAKQATAVQAESSQAEGAVVIGTSAANSASPVAAAIDEGEEVVVLSTNPNRRSGIEAATGEIFAIDHNPSHATPTRTRTSEHILATEQTPTTPIVPTLEGTGLAEDERNTVNATPKTDMNIADDAASEFEVELPPMRFLMRRDTHQHNKGGKHGLALKQRVSVMQHGKRHRQHSQGTWVDLPTQVEGMYLRVTHPPAVMPSNEAHGNDQRPTTSNTNSAVELPRPPPRPMSLLTRSGAKPTIDGALRLEKLAQQKKQEADVERSSFGAHRQASNIFNAAATAALAQGDMEGAVTMEANARKHATLANDCRQRANEAAFEHSNMGVQNTFTVDLHGLHVEEALQVLENHLLNLGGLAHPGGILLIVIVGKGKHSPFGRARILPAVARYLSDASYRFSPHPENHGVIHVRLGGKNVCV